MKPDLAGAGGVQDGNAALPEGTAAPYFPVPAALRDALVAWRPVLGGVRGFMALAQYLLFSPMRDGHGVQLPHGVVYRAFGLNGSSARGNGLSAERLLGLYRDRVDPALDYMEAQHSKGLCRTVVRAGFPEDVLEIVRRFKVAPESFGSGPRRGRGGYVYLVDGTSANRRNTQAEVNGARLADAMTSAPAVPMPRSAELIRAYLNLRLGDQLFANGRYGVVARVPACVARVQELAAAGERPFETEAKADCALRQLAWVEGYPRPLYVPCDHSPRLKADHYNQLMSLPSALRPCLYSERDVELDLDKAHMAALVVVARKLGFPAPLLSEALRDAERDLWGEFADRFDAEFLPTATARRKAAKKSYAAVYGASESALLFEMLGEYRDRGGRVVGRASFDPFRPVMGHPVMAEIYETAQAVLAHVEEAGGLHDAEGRWISLGMFGAKKPEGRAKTLLSYVCASYEQALVAEAFRVATDELDAPSCYGRPAFWIWLYQADGLTLRVSSKADAADVVGRLQRAVAAKAEELGMPTRLSVAWGAP